MNPLDIARKIKHHAFVLSKNLPLPIRLQLERFGKTQRRVNQAIRVPTLRRHRHVPGSVWAVMLCRDEVDIVGHAINHLLAQGVDRVIVVDNLSTDETPRLLRALAKADDRVLVGTDSLDEWHQGAKTSRLVSLARRGGADWVILSDADEFWFAPKGTVSDRLRSQPPSVRVVDARMFDLYPTKYEGINLDDPSTVVRFDPEPKMTKVAVRPRGWMRILEGNHGVLGHQAAVEDLYIAHLQHRSFEQFERKVLRGTKALDRASMNRITGIHWREMAEAGFQARREAWAEEVEREGPTYPPPHRWQSWTTRLQTG